MLDVLYSVSGRLLTGCSLLLIATFGIAEPRGALPISVEADSFVILMAEEKAVWRGDVRATQGNYTFNTSQLTIYLEQIQSQPATASAGAGGARTTTRHGYELSASKLTYDIADDEIVASGNSELRRADEIIRADRITYAVTEGIATAMPRKDGRVFVQFFSEPGNLPFPTASPGRSAILPEAVSTPAGPAVHMPSNTPSLGQ